MNPTTSKIGPVSIALILGIGLPASFALMLNHLRPDLLAVMLSHVSGPSVLLAEAFLCFIATALYLLAALMPTKTRMPRVLLALGGAVFFTLPALLVMLVSPIIFGFMSASR